LQVLLGTVLITCSAQIKFFLPWTPVPITGQTFAVLLAGVYLGTGSAALSTILYIVFGASGLPWFAAGLGGGWSVLTGATGGYIAGFVLAAAFIGWAWKNLSWTHSFNGSILIMLFANFVLIHGPGVLWLAKVAGTTFSQAAALGLFPFIPGDLLKIIGAAFLAVNLNETAKNMLSQHIKRKKPKK
jgi:biotin transport system substrate-specific component